jgi:hypothetical protein
MKIALPAAFVAGVLISLNSLAAAPAGAPAGSTGLCNDGSYYSGAEKKGACRGHKGVKDWWGESGSAKAADKSDAKGSAKAESKAETKAASAPAAAPAAKSSTAAVAGAASSAAAPAKATTPKPAAAPAPGGGAGKVWANESTKVYHCPGDRWYGKTKQGEYMSEADAKAKGFKPDHGKACQ